MEIFLGIVSALASIKALAPYIQKWGAAFVAWFIANQDKANAAAIVDATNFILKAPNTKEARVEAARKMQAAISRVAPRR